MNDPADRYRRASVEVFPEPGSILAAVIDGDPRVSRVRRSFVPYDYAFNDGVCDGEWHEEPCPIRPTREPDRPLHGFGDMATYLCDCQVDRSLREWPPLSPEFGPVDHDARRMVFARVEMRRTVYRTTRVEDPWLAAARFGRLPPAPYPPAPNIRDEVSVWLGQCPECWAIFFRIEEGRS